MQAVSPREPPEPHPGEQTPAASSAARAGGVVRHVTFGFLAAGAAWDLAGSAGMLPPWWPAPGYVLIALGIAGACIVVFLRVLATPRGQPTRPALTLLELLAVGVLLGALTLRGDAEIPPDPPLVVAQLVAAVVIFGAQRLASRSAAPASGRPSWRDGPAPTRRP